MSEATEDETPDEAAADASDEQIDDVVDDEAPTGEDDAVEESGDAEDEAEASEESGDAEDAVADDGPEPIEEAYGCPVTYSTGQRVIHVSREAWAETATALLADGWEMCVDVTAVDYSAHGGRSLPDGVEPERFEVVASFLSHSKRERLRARTQVPEDDPSVASLYNLYPGTDYSEREVYDMFGITFDGHPDLSRILMPETWEGHPLRKDFTVGSVPVQFKAPAGRSEVQP